jgi:hypothetical protein
MAFAELEEITCGSGLPFQADVRGMTVPQTWCPFEAGPMLKHEITRAIPETARYADRPTAQSRA